MLEAAEPISSEQPDGRFGLWSIPRLRRRIRLSLAEIRRLFNVRDQVKQIIHAAMGWSDLRPSSPSQRPSTHFIRRLKIQYLAL